MKRSALPLAGVLLIAVAGGCAIAYPTGSQATPSPIISARPSGPVAEIEMDISGRPHAGSYRAVTPGGCDSEPAHDSFSVTYANASAPDGFAALHLVLSDAAQAQEDESDDFTAGISVGGAGGGPSYTLDPRNGSGTGTAQLEITPLDATLDVSAQTADGAQMDLTVICGSP